MPQTPKQRAVALCVGKEVKSLAGRPGVAGLRMTSKDFPLVFRLDLHVTGSHGIEELGLIFSITDAYPETPCTVEVCDDVKLADSVRMAASERLSHVARMSNQKHRIIAAVDAALKDTAAILRPPTPPPPPQQRDGGDIFDGVDEASSSEGGSASTDYDDSSDEGLGTDSDSSTAAEREAMEGARQRLEKLQTSEAGSSWVASVQPTRPYDLEVRVTVKVLENIATFECPRLRLVLVCTRCDGQLTAELERSPGFESVCPSCGGTVEASYEPLLMYEGARVVGTLSTFGCNVVDLLPSTWTLSCFSCNGVTESIPVPLRNVHELKCHSCSCAQRILLDAPRFVRRDEAQRQRQAHRQRGETGGRARAARARADAAEGIAKGKPLPSQGTCAHYRHSHRWFRFPCCGRAFPCDLCHEASPCPAAALGVHATRMICGYCAHESSVTDTCRSCQKRLGAKNPDNVARMSKNDPRKYRNKSKTISRKSMRRKRQQQGKAGGKG